MKCLVLCLLLVSLVSSIPPRATTNLNAKPSVPSGGETNVRPTDPFTEYLNYRASQGHRRPYYYQDFDDDDYYKYLMFSRLTGGTGPTVRVEAAPRATATRYDTPVETNVVRTAPNQAQPQAQAPQYYFFYDD